MKLLADLSADYLCAQIEAGADAVQIFDSWAGVLGETEFERFCVKPVRKIIDQVRQRHAAGADHRLCQGRGKPARSTTARRPAADAIGLDWSVPLSFARELQNQGPVQGNLDPMRVVAGGRALDEGIDAILSRLGQGPLIFNLGHGITPQADPGPCRASCRTHTGRLEKQPDIGVHGI